MNATKELNHVIYIYINMRCALWYFFIGINFNTTSYFPGAAVQRFTAKKEFLEISQNSQGNTFARVSFLIKKRLWHRCFPVNFAKFLRTRFYTEHLRWLLLFMQMFNFFSAFSFFSILAWVSKKIS